MVAEVLAGEAAQVVDRGLADRVVLVAEALDQPLDAMAVARALVPLAPLALARAEVLRGQRDERAARVLAAAVGALDRADQIGDRLDVAELDDRRGRRGDDLRIGRVDRAARARRAPCAEVRRRIAGERLDRASRARRSPDRTAARRARTPRCAGAARRRTPWRRTACRAAARSSSRSAAPTRPRRAGPRARAARRTARRAAARPVTANRSTRSLPGNRCISAPSGLGRALDGLGEGVARRGPRFAASIAVEQRLDRDAAAPASIDSSVPCSKRGRVRRGGRLGRVLEPDGRGSGRASRLVSICSTSISIDRRTPAGCDSRPSCA